MIFRPFYDVDTGCAAYVFGCGGLGVCAVVDPRAEDVDAYAAFAASKGMRITRDAFVAALADVPPKPAEMARRLRANQGREAAAR